VALNENIEFSRPLAFRKSGSPEEEAHHKRNSSQQYLKEPKLPLHAVTPTFLENFRQARHTSYEKSMHKIILCIRISGKET